MESRGYYLSATRQVWPCPICNEPIREYQGMDMHEPLVTRNDVRTVDEQYRYLIFNKRNTTLVHHNCHMKIIGHGGKDVFESGARQLVRYEGYFEVHSFLVELTEFAREPALFALRRFESLSFVKETE